MSSSPRSHLRIRRGSGAGAARTSRTFTDASGQSAARVERAGRRWIVTYNGQEVSRHRFERLAIREARWFVRAAARFD